MRVTGEELLANWFGWANRTLEATANPDDVPWAWRLYAYRGYLLLQELDRRLLESRLPPAIFYNLMLVRAQGARLNSGVCPSMITQGFPLFPLGIVALPHESVPLHIFEQRYRTMIERCL